MTDLTVKYSVEEIPDIDYVFYRIHKSEFRNNTIIPGAFKKRNDGMSVDWSYYGTAERLKQVANNPSDNGIVQAMVGNIRELSILEVIHKPSNHNRSHSLIRGIPDAHLLKVKVRIHLKRCFNEWAIPFQ